MADRRFLSRLQNPNGQFFPGFHDPVCEEFSRAGKIGHRGPMRLIFNLALATVALAQARADTMKAIVAHEYGAPAVLKYEDAPKPEPKENEMLVRVIACG